MKCCVFANFSAQEAAASSRCCNVANRGDAAGGLPSCALYHSCTSHTIHLGSRDALRRTAMSNTYVSWSIARNDYNGLIGNIYAGIKFI